MTKKYDVIWTGLDNGHEGQWYGPIWLPTFKILAKHDGANYNDAESPIYIELEEQLPTVAWRTADSTSTAGTRLFFRDAREPWSSTGVVHFNEANKTISITELGKKLDQGSVSPSEVFVMSMEAHNQGGDHPFQILSSAFLDPEASQGLTLEQLMGGVMQNFRPHVDDLASALLAGHGNGFAATPVRRFKHMLTMLESVGAIAAKDSKYIAWNLEILKRLAKRTSVIPLDVSGMINQFVENCTDSCLKINAKTPLQFITSCISKRFLILTGLAGSGKTKIAQAFARWITPANENGDLDHAYYAIIPVGADWTGNENVLGYPNGLNEESYISKPALDLILHARENEAIPHFLILDEMNLSHVERYFADILSAIESEEEIQLYNGSNREACGNIIPSRVALPKNLFIIGTVNVDETTYMFSPKVLDRANVIEFRMDAGELGTFLSNPAKPDLSQLDGKGKSFGKAFVDATKSQVAVPTNVKTRYDSEMLLLFKTLQSDGAEFGYRTAYETARFIHFYNLLGNHPDGDTSWFNTAFDCVVLQKMLPKLHGSRSKLGPLLKKLWYLCVNDEASRGGDVLKAVEAASRSSDKKDEPARVVPSTAPYPLSAEKIGRMWSLLMENGFASFAEA